MKRAILPTLLLCGCTSQEATENMRVSIERPAASQTPADTGVFRDVPTTYWAAAWIEELHSECITTSCSNSPLM